MWSLFVENNNFMRSLDYARDDVKGRKLRLIA